MLDRSIPFYNAILKCTHWEPVAVRLRDGYRIRPYRPGDEAAWAGLEYGIGDFASCEDALDYFSRTYLRGDPRDLERVFFAEEEAGGRVVGSVAAWRDRRGDGTAASLHWLNVDPPHQGRGLGKALLQTAMNWYRNAGELPVYLHTQPWSYKAILLYAGQGFRMQRTDTFSHYENQYEAVMRTLQGLVSREAYEKLLRESED